MSEPERWIVRYSPKLGGRFFLVCGCQPHTGPGRRPLLLINWPSADNRLPRRT